MIEGNGHQNKPPMQQKKHILRRHSGLAELKGLVGQAVSMGLPGIGVGGEGIWVNGNFYSWQDLKENPGLVQELIDIIRRLIQQYTAEQGEREIERKRQTNPKQGRKGFELGA